MPIKVDACEMTRTQAAAWALLMLWRFPEATPDYAEEWRTRFVLGMAWTKADSVTRATMLLIGRVLNDNRTDQERIVDPSTW